MGTRRDDEPIIKFDGLWVRKQNTLLFFTFLSHFSFSFPIVASRNDTIVL